MFVLIKPQGKRLELKDCKFHTSDFLALKITCIEIYLTWDAAVVVVAKDDIVFKLIFDA